LVAANAPFWRQLWAAEKTGIHSFGTRDTYLDKWQELGRFCKEEFRIRDIEKLTTEHVHQFLAYKIEMGVSYSHWSGNAAAIVKLENALNAYSEKFNRGKSEITNWIQAFYQNLFGLDSGSGRDTQTPSSQRISCFVEILLRFISPKA